MAYTYPLIGKIYYKIPIKLTSPLIIGCGEDQNSDVDVQRDNAGVPFIPATSIVGVIRQYAIFLLGNQEKNINLKQTFNILFGDDIQEFNKAREKDKDKSKKTSQSALMCDDILLKDFKIKVRDGVAIDGATGTAKNQSKYNYEIIEPSNKVFHFEFEINIRKGFDKETFKQIMYSIIWAMAQGRIRLGAKTTKGFGRFSVVDNKYNVAELDFSKENDFIRWLINNPESKVADFKTPPDFARQINTFKIDAVFNIKNSLLIRSNEIPPQEKINTLQTLTTEQTAVNEQHEEKKEPKAPDTVQLTCNGKPVLPGTSLRGAIRHRAEKIFRYIKKSELTEEQFYDLFGNVLIEDQNKNKEAEKAIKSKVFIEETYINADAIVHEIQSRIKIDRFTGGVMSGALFQIMPIWPVLDDQLHIEISIDKFEEWEAGLLLLVFKDLCSGDLAVGGETSIGRGTLEVKNASIIITDSGKEQKFDLQFEKNCAFKSDSVKDLEKYVTSLTGRNSNGKE